MNYLLLSRIIGAVLFFFSLTMLTMIPFALVYGEYIVLFHVMESFAICALFGGLLYMLGRRARQELFRREALAIVGLSWVLVAFFGSLPFLLGGMANSITDAFFESISGLTTTGASILTDIEAQPKTLLYWRSFEHFVGGLGIIVFFIAILPILGVGGKTLFKQEVAGPVVEGFTPRIKDTAMMLCKIYFGLVVIEMILLMLFGMNFYEALNQSFATIATGGFSPKNSSIGAYGPAIQWITIVFMILGATNFVLHLRFLQGDWKVYLRDEEFRLYIGIIAVSTILITASLYIYSARAVSNPGGLNFRDALFSVTTINTCTGFATQDFSQWPTFCRGLLFLLMFVGGMAGSTTGGIKTIRWLILGKSAAKALRSESNPRRISIVKIDGRRLGPRMELGTLVFLFVYLLIWAVSSLILLFIEADHSVLTSLTAVATCMAGIGPGLDTVGPASNYEVLNSISKWILSFDMLLGRLELYAILIVMKPGFWLGR